MAGPRIYLCSCSLVGFKRERLFIEGSKMNHELDLIVMTFLLSMGAGIYFYFFEKNKVFGIWLAATGCSAIIPLFLFLRFDLGISWFVWFACYACIAIYIKKKYPAKSKEWEKSFRFK